MKVKYAILYVWMLFLVVGCTSSSTGKEALVSVTIEPQRYFVEKIGGADFTVNCVIPSGQSPETYDPTPKQMMRIGQSRAYLRIGYIGFEQAWMKNLEEQNPHMQVFDLSKGMTFIENEEPDSHHHGSVDPHIWTSIRGAQVIARNVRDALSALNPEHKADYALRYDSLMQEIEDTKMQMSRLLEPYKGTSFIIYHPALTYLAADYGLTQISVEVEGKEPSAAYLSRLIDTSRTLKISKILYQKQFDKSTVEAIATELGLTPVVVDPLAENVVENIESLAHIIADSCSQ